MECIHTFKMSFPARLHSQASHPVLMSASEFSNSSNYEARCSYSHASSSANAPALFSLPTDGRELSVYYVNCISNYESTASEASLKKISALIGKCVDSLKFIKPYYKRDADRQFTLLIACPTGTPQREIVDDLREISPISYIKSYNLPLLSINGSNDSVVPPNQPQKLYCRLRDSDRVYFREFNDFASSAKSVASTTYTDFLAKYLKDEPKR